MGAKFERATHELELVQDKADDAYIEANRLYNNKKHWEGRTRMCWIAQMHAWI